MVYDPEGPTFASLRPLRLRAVGEAVVAVAEVPDSSVSTADERASQTALYRYYDDRDRLLYVGITHAIAERTSKHIKASDWMTFAARSTIQRYLTRRQAEDAEQLAIALEKPLFNSRHSNPGADRRLVAYLVETGRLDLLKPDISRA